MQSKEKMREVYWERKKNHLCTKCGEPLGEETRSMCAKCRWARSVYSKYYRETLVKLSRCTRCGGMNDDRRYSQCSKCRNVTMLRVRERRKKCKKMNSGS